MKKNLNNIHMVLSLEITSECKAPNRLVRNVRKNKKKFSIKKQSSR